MLMGDLIYICPVERDDLEKLREWRNNPDFRKYFREYREIGKEQQEAWFQSKVLSDPSTLMFSIRKKDDHQLLGCCGLCYINWVHKNADLSLYIGWNLSYIDVEGFAEEACRLLFNYGFKELGLKKIWTEIYEFDQLKYELYSWLGFAQDGLLRSQYFWDGKWWDSRMLSLLCEDWL